MYRTVLFPNIDRSDVNIDQVGEVSNAIHYLDIQAILFVDVDRHRIGVLDMMDVEGVMVDKRSEALAPHVSFNGRQLLQGAALHDLYSAMRKNASHISSSACISSNIAPRGTMDGESVIFSVSPAFAWNSWQSTCLVACQSSRGHGFTAITRTSGKGLSVETLSLDYSQRGPDKQSQHCQYPIQGDISFGSTWQRTTADGHTAHFNWLDMVSDMGGETKHTQNETTKFSIPLIFSHQQNAAIYLVEVAAPGNLPRQIRENKKSHLDEFSAANFSMRCTRTIEFAAPAVVQSIHPARILPAHPTQTTFCLGLLNGDAYEYAFSSDDYQHRILNRPAGARQGRCTLSNPLRQEKSFHFDPVLTVLYVDVPQPHCHWSVACVVHNGYIEWVIAARLESEHEEAVFTSTDKCILRQELSDVSGGYTISTPVRMATLCDMGRAVTVLATTTVYKMRPPTVQRCPLDRTATEMPGDIASIFRVSDEMEFWVTLQPPEIILQLDYSQQVISGLLPPYAFIEKFDKRFLSQANATGISTTNTKIVNSLSHTLGEAGRLAGAIHKHTSSAFPIAVLSSTSHSRVLYVHFTSRSVKFDHEENDGESRVVLKEVANLPLHVPYCIVEYCDGDRQDRIEPPDLGISDVDVFALDQRVITPYHTATDNQRVAFWAHQLRSEWLRGLSPLQLSDLSPWNVLDMKIWEKERFLSIDDRIGQRNLRCLTVTRREFTIEPYQSISYETALAAEASADIITYLRGAMHKSAAQFRTTTPVPDVSGPHDTMTFVKPLDASRMCPFCDGQVARVYRVFYPGIVVSGNQVNVKSDVYYSTAIRCEREHALAECELSGVILSAGAFCGVSLGGGNSQRCQSCESVCSTAALVAASCGLCVQCSLPFA
ncbi:hypothetical protein XU18_1629 [Perkinsela sp. CCAP 1560/4]|nr:hypothetical protein XU18_1629 [Perkinsela sp. CCAP 1560/4]|eukprot:KNH07738.1 hypothetical protein XU18_1629 [Perkinsela sp. CCAP 1560/4]